MDGSDQVTGGDGNDTAYGNDGTDYLNGENGDDTLWGGDGNDFLWGAAGNDVLHAQGGSNVIYGGPGSDHMYGHAGDANIFAFDTFVFVAGDSGVGVAKRDYIDDFRVGADHIDLSGMAGEFHSISLLANGHYLLSIDSNHDRKVDMEIEIAASGPLTDADIWP